MVPTNVMTFTGASDLAQFSTSEPFAQSRLKFRSERSML